MNPELVAKSVLGHGSYLAMFEARISWPRIVNQAALELFIHKDRWEDSVYDMYSDSIREELIRLGC